MNESTPENDPNFIPEGAPTFIPYPIEPPMGVKGATSQGLEDLNPNAGSEEVNDDGDTA